MTTGVKSIILIILSRVVLKDAGAGSHDDSRQKDDLIGSGQARGSVSGCCRDSCCFASVPLTLESNLNIYFI